jgi:hypothetical protein
VRRNLFWLSDEQWSRIETHLPTDVRGVERVDDRRVISGIVHVLKGGPIVWLHGSSPASSIDRHRPDAIGSQQRARSVLCLPWSSTSSHPWNATGRTVTSVIWYSRAAVKSAFDALASALEAKLVFVTPNQSLSITTVRQGANRGSPLVQHHPTNFDRLGRKSG